MFNQQIIVGVQNKDSLSCIVFKVDSSRLIFFSELNATKKQNGTFLKHVCNCSSNVRC